MLYHIPRDKDTQKKQYCERFFNILSCFHTIPSYHRLQQPGTEERRHNTINIIEHIMITARLAIDYLPESHGMPHHVAYFSVSIGYVEFFPASNHFTGKGAVEHHQAWNAFGVIAFATEFFSTFFSSMALIAKSIYFLFRIFFFFGLLTSRL